MQSKNYNGEFKLTGNKKATRFELLWCCILEYGVFSHSLLPQTSYP